VSAEAMARQFVKDELVVAIHSCCARCGTAETKTLIDLTVAQISASENKHSVKTERSGEMESNRSSDVSIEFYEPLLSGVKSNEAQNDLVEQLAASYRAEDQVKRNQGEN
jgi:hypothetical protein